jgi:O-acetyl-ADP-ribose deacetylase
MELKVNQTRIVLKRGDLTREAADAIVNAANSSLLGGGGVDGAIHAAGGPAILAESSRLGGCEPGDAKATTAGRLPAKMVVHTVGPIWRGGAHGEDRTLASAYRRSLEVARERGARTVAFPSISTGVYGFPIERAAGIALATIRDFLVDADQFETVTLVLWSDADLATYERALRALGGAG